MAVLALLFSVILALPVAHAQTSSEDIIPRSQDFLRPWAVRKVLPAHEVYLRTQAVFDHFHTPPEQDSQASLDELQGAETLKEALTRLPYLQFRPEYHRFAQMDSRSLKAFQDRDSNLDLDYEVQFATQADQRRPVHGFHENLLRASQLNSPARPLQGVRIALDPGHMGSSIWDQRTGKYIREDGVLLSEGVLTLQTALLLEKELVDLGAEVLLTRRSLQPVTDLEWDELDIDQFARAELRNQSLRGWFVNLVSGASSLEAMIRGFETDVNVRRLFSEAMRSNYFVSRIDLQARAEKMMEFQPDISLVIHYDISPDSHDPHGVRPNGPNWTKVYVPGAFVEDEFASRESRRDFAKHLLHPHAWNSSVSLASTLVRRFRTDLGLSPDPWGGQYVVEVEDGVFSRNLGVSRRLTDHAMGYLEVLFYNSPEEFKALSNRIHPMWIDGENHPYSDRLVEVVSSIRKSVIEFVSGYGATE